MTNCTLTRRLVAVALIILVMAVLPALALEKVGTTSMQVLKLAMGVRGIGM